MPFGVNSDASFRAQKPRIRVRGCVFSYRRDSRGPIGKKLEKHKIRPKHFVLPHMAIEGVLGDAEKSYESVSVKFELFGHEKSRDEHKNHFLVF